MDKAGKQGGGRFAAGLKSAIGPAVALLGTAAVGSFLKDSIGEAREAQKVGALTNAVIKSTGGVANVSAKEVDRLSSAISAKIGVDDEAIASGQNMLLTFGNVRNEVGKGNKIFTRATIAASDMAAAFGGDAVSNSKMLGKALNDPTKGVSALTRVGVSFTQQQKDQIKTMQASGNTLGAQKVILGELSKQTKGAAEATATSGEKAAVAVGNLKESIGTALLPVVDRAATALTTKVIPAISEFVTGMQDGTGAGGKVASTLTDIYNSAKPVAATIVTVVSSFGGMPGATQKLILLAGAALLLKSRFSGAVPSIQNFDRTAALATAKTVAMRGGALAAGGALAGMAQSAGGASTALGSLATVGAGIATGFAVAGPWGAAIGAGASVLSLFASRSRSAAAAQDRLDSAGKRVAATLNQQTGAITANTRAIAAKELADSGALSAASKMGISLKDALDASLGNEGAMKRVATATEAWSTRLIKSGDYTEKQEAQLRLLTKQIGATSSSLAEQRVKIAQTNEALGKAESASKGAGKAIRDMGKDAGQSAGIMAKAGGDAGSGFYNGLNGWLGDIAAIGARIGETVAKAAKDKLKIKSPSRVMFAIGGHTVKGLELGIAGGEAGLRKAMARISKAIAQSQDLKKTKKGMSKTQRARIAAFNKNAKAETKQMQRAVDQQLKALLGQAKRVDQAQSKLNDLKAQRTSTSQSIGESVRGELDLSGVRSFNSAASRVSGLASRAKAFAGKLRALLKAGIPAGLVQEVAGLGTVEGLRVADALLSGSKQQIGQLAKDYAGVSTYSKQIGDVVAGGMYDAGIRAQEGILKGLLDDKAIQRAADQLAKKLTKAVRKSLGIKSPSRVMQQQVGRFIPQGIAAGIDDGQSALDRRVAGMVDVASIGSIRPGSFAGVAATSRHTEYVFTTLDPSVMAAELERRLRQQQRKDAMGAGI